MDTERPGITAEELALAARNHGLPLEALREPITPAGLHYVLVHFDIPFVDPARWRLHIDGHVERTLELSLDAIRGRLRVTEPVTFECAGNGRALLEPRPVSQPWLVEAVGTGEWTGIALSDLLAEAGVRDGAVDVLFTAMDRGIEDGVEQVYQRALPLAEATADGVLLAHAMNGAPLPPQHGFPLRLVVPGWYGMTQVKWLERITVLDHEFDGFQHRERYRLRSSEDDPGTPLTRMLPRALMVPPGIPDFMSRVRHVEPGPCMIEGRAWSGWGEIVAVDVSSDGGETWSPAALNDAVGTHAWRSWRFGWEAVPGEHVLCCRARDDSGNEQPLETRWSVNGYANNEIQRVPVRVR